MNHLGYIAVISILGALIGIYAVLSPWVSGSSGMDLMTSSYEGFQKFIPITILSLLVFAVLLSTAYMARPIWFIPFITFFVGVAIMILTSIFAMWVIDGTKVVENSDYGFWLSYVSGALILIGSALTYTNQFRRVQTSYS